VRFRVRTMLVLVLVTGGWLGWFVRSARIQHDAVAAVERGGGSVTYSWQWKNGREIPYADQSPPRPKWLVDLFGIHYFGHVTKVVNVTAGNADAGMGSIGTLRGLESLELGGFLVTDAGLRHLKDLTSLQSLDISCCDVTDEGLVYLKGLTGLKVLSLRRTWVTDAGLAHLKSLTSLELLDLEETQVTDGGIRDLKRAMPTTIIRR
jgi:hypothetical protein